MSKPETLLQFLNRCKQELSEQKNKDPQYKDFIVQHCSYIVKSYCKLPVGESVNEKEVLKFRPFDTFEYYVKKETTGNEDRFPDKIVVTRSNIIDNTTHGLYWSYEKMEDWLSKNCLKQNKKQRHVKR